MTDHITIGITLPDIETAFEWEVFGHVFTRQVSTGELGLPVTVTADRSDDGYVWVSDSAAGSWTRSTT